MKYQVNIDISAGLPFRRIFYVTNADLSPINLTGATVTAYIAKHPGAIFATDTTSEHVFYNYIPFTCVIEDGIGGAFSLSLTEEQTFLLTAGQYYYSATITDVNGTPLSEIVSGPAFVENAMNPIFGTIGPQTLP